MMRVRLVILSVIAGLTVPTSAARAGDTGVLLLAHGGNEQWNAQVASLAAKVDRVRPTEVAFGMATRSNIQAAVDRLRQRGVGEIVAVPLFVSSWSSVITSTEYLLRQRLEAPPQLAIFAKMKHSGHDGHGAAATSPSGPTDGTLPIDAPVPIRMTPALNDHPIVADILISRARSISSDPGLEAAIIVAHGPVDDEENRRWLADMSAIAERVQEAQPFASIDYLTLRDDAPKAVRDAATAQLRELVSRRIQEGRRVLILPLLVSFGGIERGLRERLDGLPYTMPSAALMPDDRLVGWVLEMADAR